MNFWSCEFLLSPATILKLLQSLVLIIIRSMWYFAGSGVDFFLLVFCWFSCGVRFWLGITSVVHMDSVGACFVFL
jgi:hypothetical protein